MRSIYLIPTFLYTLAIQVAADASPNPRGMAGVVPAPMVARANNCPPGQYNNGGNCQTCPAGNQCTGQNPPQKCQQGLYATGGASSCTPCPSGTYAPNNESSSCMPVQCGYTGKGANNNRGDIQQDACGKGKYSTGGTSSCMDCPAGSSCTSDATCSPVQCTPGSYSDKAGASTCTQCPAGTYINKSGATSCCSCCAGSFNSATGQTHCQQCPSMGLGVVVTSDIGSKNSNKCHVYSPGDPVPLPQTCTDDSVTQNQNTCPTDGPLPTGLVTRKRTVPRGCSNRRLTMCEVKTGRGGWECIDTQSTLDACGSCDNDCTAIQYVGDVRCISGQCSVSSCLKGFTLEYNADGKPSCVPVSKRAFWLVERDMELLD